MLDLSINGYSLIYVVWNIILGIIPFFLCYAIFSLQKQKSNYKKIYQFFVFVIWLLFVPNAAYIFTDMRHINGFCLKTTNNICVGNAWMIAFFFAYAIIGWVLYYYSLEQMLVYVRQNISKKNAKLFPLLAIPIISLGLLLGLVDRLNTWDVFVKLPEVLKTASVYIFDYQSTKNFLVFTLVLYFLYYSGKYIFKPIEDIKILKKLIQ